jgi:ATP-dependent DNA helicase RecQ
MTYAEGRHCRHAELAAHLGERLEPCGIACDVCAGEARDATEPSIKQTRPAAKRSVTTSADAIVVLKAVASLPFPVGKTGLIRLLEGSIQSRIQGDRSPYFGGLGELQKSKIDALIDRLVDDGYLLRDLDHEFKLIRLTQRGAATSPEDLLTYDENPERPKAPRSAAEPVDDLDLSLDEQVVLRNLQDWRRERAVHDAVPPYVVAPNATLTEIARRRPASPRELVEIKGFGPTRVERYGDEILAILVERTTPDTPD